QATRRTTAGRNWTSGNASGSHGHDTRKAITAGERGRLASDTATLCPTLTHRSWVREQTSCKQETRPVLQSASQPASDDWRRVVASASAQLPRYSGPNSRIIAGCRRTELGRPPPGGFVPTREGDGDLRRRVSWPRCDPTRGPYR